MKKIFTQEELDNMTEVGRIAAAERFKADFFAKNTAVLNSKDAQRLGQGKALAEDQENIAQLMERVKNEYMSSILHVKGYTSDQKVTVNLKTGEVKILPNE